MSSTAAADRPARRVSVRDGSGCGGGFGRGGGGETPPLAPGLEPEPELVVCLLRALLGLPPQTPPVMTSSNGAALDTFY